MIKINGLADWTTSKKVIFHEQRALLQKVCAIWPIIKLEVYIMVLNNVTKFHKVLIKTNQLREQNFFQMLNFHKQRAITTESMVRYGPLSNLRKTLW